MNDIDSGFVPPFMTVHAVLTYYVHNNPARMKSVNLAEPDGGTPTRDPQDTWAACKLAIAAIFDKLPAKQKAAFYIRYLCPPQAGKERERTIEDQKSIADIAAKVGAHSRDVQRWIDDITEDLAAECVERELIPLAFLEELRKWK